MWGAIKKAINSNLSKPLDRLIEERVSSLDSRMSRMQSEIDKCSKKYPVFRDTGYLQVNAHEEGKTFKYEGSPGVILALITREGKYWLIPELKLDGVKIPIYDVFHLVNRDFSGYSDSNLSKICIPLEFKNSIEITVPKYSTYSSEGMMRCFFKTEK